jgi:hypothetical protein
VTFDVAPEPAPMEVYAPEPVAPAEAPIPAPPVAPAPVDSGESKPVEGDEEKADSDDEEEAAPMEEEEEQQPGRWHAHDRLYWSDVPPPLCVSVAGATEGYRGTVYPVSFSHLDVSMSTLVVLFVVLFGERSFCARSY